MLIEEVENKATFSDPNYPYYTDSQRMEDLESEGKAADAVTDGSF